MPQEEKRIMHILAIISGEYGRRHVDNIREHGPSEWHITEWKTPPAFPPVIDDPEDHLPDKFPSSDLVLSFAEHRGVAELLPEIVRMKGAAHHIMAECGLVEFVHEGADLFENRLHQLRLIEEQVK